MFRAVAFIVGFAVVMIANQRILEGVAGTTLGWWLTEIAVVREDCAEVGLRRSALRNSMRLGALPFVVHICSAQSSLGTTEKSSG
ncbi:MAG: RDD family protein [Halobacteriota archaeon]